MMSRCCIHSFAAQGLATNFKLASEGETHQCEACGHAFVLVDSQWTPIHGPVYRADERVQARPAPVTTRELDELAGGRSHVEIHPGCHPEAGLSVTYIPEVGALAVRCKQCRGALLAIYVGCPPDDDEGPDEERLPS